MKRPAWAMRGCSFPGCQSLAKAECQAFDNELQRPCRLPLCDWHTGQRGGFTFCRLHRTGAGVVASPEPQPIQARLFDPPEY